MFRHTTWFIRYVYYLYLQFLNDVIIIKTKVLHPQGWVTLDDFCYPVWNLLVLLLPNTFKCLLDLLLHMQSVVFPSSPLSSTNKTDHHDITPNYIITYAPTSLTQAIDTINVREYRRDNQNGQSRDIGNMGTQDEDK